MNSKAAISAVLLMFLALLGSLSAQALTIVENGQPAAVIVIGEFAADTVRHAANEMQSYIAKSTRAQLQIFTDNQTIPKGANLILLGESGLTKARNLSSAGLKPDGYRMRVGSDYIYILGNDYKGVPVYGFRNPWQYEEVYNPELKLGAFGEAGTLYGVYHFLEKTCGIRWYMHGKIGEVVPARKSINIEAGSYDKSPDFEYRYPWLCNFNVAPEEALWFRRVGFGAKAPVQIIHSFDLMLTQNPKFKEQHPEYFALIDGQRDFSTLSTMIGNGNFCLSNPGVADFWVKYIADYFSAHPEQDVFALSPNDGMMKICECEECQAQLSPELGESGKFSNYIWKFVDNVARRVGEKFPDKLVGCIAYEHYNAPPSNIARLSDNTAVMVCKSRGSYTDKSYHEKMNKALLDWNKKTSNLYCWEYYLYSWLPWRGLPVAFTDIISQDMKFLRGVSKGEFIEAESVQPSDEPGQVSGHLNFPGMAHLNLYVTAKCLWDADTDVKKLLSEYYTLFYGPASAQMQQFWILTERIWNNKSGDYPINIYTPSRLQALSGYLKSAKAKTAEGSLYRQRVELIETEFGKGKSKMLGLENRKPPVLNIKREAKAISLGADIDRPEWRSSNSIGLVYTDGSPADFSTLIFARADSQALVFTFVAKQPAADSSKNDKTKQQDTVEVFLEPNPGTCYRYSVDSKGALKRYSVENSKQTVLRSAGSAKSWKLAGKWIVQLRIPLAELHITDSAEEIKANFYATRTSGKTVSEYSWFPIQDLPKYSPQKFGRIIIQ